MHRDHYEPLVVFAYGYESFCKWGNTQPCPYELDTREAKHWTEGFVAAERDFSQETK